MVESAEGEEGGGNDDDVYSGRWHENGSDKF